MNPHLCFNNIIIVDSSIYCFNIINSVLFNLHASFKMCAFFSLLPNVSKEISLSDKLKQLKYLSSNPPIEFFSKIMLALE